MDVGQKILRESRRIGYQLSCIAKYRHPNPYTRMRRANKPEIIKANPDWEFSSLLEIVAESIARPGRQFTFAQVGAFDGLSYDSLPEFAAQKGWRGVLIEPQPVAFKKLVAHFGDNPNFAFENIAVGDHESELEFFTTADGDSNLASMDLNHLRRFGIARHQVVSIPVQVKPLMSVLETHDLCDLDLLQIDAEGFDGQIIRSLDFERTKPRILRYEHLNLLEKERSSLIRLLRSHGYRFLLEDNDTIALLQ